MLSEAIHAEIDEDRLVEAMEKERSDRQRIAYALPAPEPRP
jgi:hypothetical protein